MPMDKSEAETVLLTPAAADMDGVKASLLANPHWLHGDPDLLAHLGLRIDAANLEGGNVVDFGPVALSRVVAAHQREFTERQRLEAIAQANFAAQSQTHSAVIDALEAESLEDLALRVDSLARHRFGLAIGALALEGAAAPVGWVGLVEGQVDLILGRGQPARLGPVPTAAGLFGAMAPTVRSVALARLTIGSHRRQGVMALGSADPEAFSVDMGCELLTFLAEVVSRSGGRWPPA